MSTTIRPRNPPTPKMVNGLIKFGYPEAEVSKMDFDTASARLKIEFAKLEEKQKPKWAGPL